MTTHHGFDASNPRFDWKAQFNGKSALIQPARGDWRFGLALQAFGFEGAMQEVESPTFGTCVEGQRITYGWTEGLSEWWINDRRGFEHGFTVHERPARLEADRNSPLVFELDAIGSLSPRANEARTGLSLHTGVGTSMLRYDGLVAFDANGEALSAWLEVTGRSVRICVDESFAEYPILVDPIVQQAYIKASNTDAGDLFGVTMAASGDTVVVAAFSEDSSATGIDGDQSDNSAYGAGAVYTFDTLGSAGTAFCTAEPNSTGTAGRLTGCGNASVMDNDLTLVAWGLPMNVSGFYLTSTVQGFAMNPGGSEGNLCLGGSIGRYVGPGQIQQSDANGRFSLLIDSANTPQPNGSVSISAGETWNFQVWHRDTDAMGATSNFTNGLEVLFTM